MTVKPDRWSQRRVTKKAMDAHLRKWTDFMGLGSWTIGYSPDDPDSDEHMADSHSFVPTEMAAIRIQACPVAQVDRLVVHELTHVLLARMDDLFMKTASDRGSEAKALLEGQWKQETERVVEKIVDCLVDEPRAGLPQEGRLWQSAFPGE